MRRTQKTSFIHRRGQRVQKCELEKHKVLSDRNSWRSKTPGGLEAPYPGSAGPFLDGNSSSDSFSAFRTPIRDPLGFASCPSLNSRGGKSAMYGFMLSQKRGTILSPAIILLRKNTSRGAHCPGLASSLLSENCPPVNFSGLRNPTRITTSEKFPLITPSAERQIL